MNDEIYVQLGITMRECREKAGLTQEEAAEKLGVTRATLARYELGQRKVTLDFLFKLERVYKADMLYAVRKAEDNVNRDSNEE